MRLILTDDANINNMYEIPHCIYDPDSPVNIIGIPVLSALFNDAKSASDAVVEDKGSTIISSGRRSYFKWYNGKHNCRFTHPDSQIS